MQDTDPRPMNIVRMEEFDPTQSRPSSAECERLLRQCASLWRVTLVQSLNGMMEKVDDALFEMAEKADSSDAQQGYFDAMREIRVRRKGIESGFSKGLDESFEAIWKGNPEPEEKNRELAGDSEVELLLVGDEDLEESLAITNMVSKIRSYCREDLSTLNRRIGLLLGRPDLDTEENPVGPEVVCRTLERACGGIEAGVQVKLIIFKLFDRFVIGDLQRVYQSINRLLVEQGVLPKIKHNYSQNPSSVRSGQSPSSQSTVSSADVAETAGHGEQVSGAPSGTPVEHEILALLRQLAGNEQGVGGPAGPVSGAGHGVAATAASTQGGPAVVPVEMLAALTRLQQGQNSAGNFSIDPELLAGGAANVLHDLKPVILGENHGQLDSVTIDMVAMIFDFVLDDKAIPDAMRVLIGRLQIPVLKVAMLEKEFLAKKSHPARKLIDVMSRSAIGWDGRVEESEALHVKATEVVDHITEEFDQDVSIFASVLEDFQDFVAEEEENFHARIEQASKVAAGKERLSVAKEAAEAVIARITGSTVIPEFVAGFVNEVWRNLLVITHIREGDGSYHWKQYVNTLEHLVWSVSPGEVAMDKDRLLNFLPGLVNRLNQGFETIDMEARARSEFLDRLSEYHADLVKHGRLDQSRVERDAADEDSITGEQTLAPEVIEEVFGSGDVDVEEITLEGANEPEIDAIEDEHTEFVRSLEKGIWIEFMREDGSVSRARLTWISPETGCYLFTNRKGLRECEKTIYGLAADFRSGHASVIDAAPLLDRAMNHLLKGLRGQVSETATPETNAS